MEVHFDYQNVILYREKGKDSIETPLPVKVFDPLSITYFFRLESEEWNNSLDSD